jgi:ABC-2 type transport system permease protein
VTRVGWAIADGWTVTGREVRRWLRDPTPLVLGLLFPVMVVLMFAYLLGGGIAVPSGGNYREVLMPGMFALTMVFGVESTFAAVTSDAARGITDRFRSLPMAPSAIVVGRSAADMLSSALGLIVMIGCGIAVGWRWHGGAGSALLAVGLLLLLRFALLWIAIYTALLLRSPTALVAVQIVVWPIGFLSNVFAAPATMPSWLGAVVEWNPLSATTAATRELFANPGWGGTSWAAHHSPLMALVWPAVLIAVFFPLSVRAYRRLNQ